MPLSRMEMDHLARKNALKATTAWPNERVSGTVPLSERFDGTTGTRRLMMMFESDPSTRRLHARTAVIRYPAVSSVCNMSNLDSERGRGRERNGIMVCMSLLVSVDICVARGASGRVGEGASAGGI